MDSQPLMSRTMEMVKSPRIWIILVIGFIISVAGYWVYQKYVAPRMSPSYVANKEFIQSGETIQGTQEAEVILFYTTWCPACKKAKPIWNQVKEEMNGKELNGKEIIFREVDCDKEEALADKFNIEGYPTIKMVVSGNVIEYDARPDVDTMIEFIQTQSAL